MQNSISVKLKNKVCGMYCNENYIFTLIRGRVKRANNKMYLEVDYINISRVLEDFKTSMQFFSCNVPGRNLSQPIVLQCLCQVYINMALLVT